MFLVDLLTPFFIFAIGLIMGLIPPFIWGKIGGDEPLIEKHPNLTGFLRLIHHWQIGIVIVVISLILPNPYNIFIVGWGTSTTLDDILFHSFESYFKRKET